MITKVTLSELMEFEEKLLLINEKYNTEDGDISFGDFIMLQQNLDEIGEITNYYFNIVEKYHNDEQRKKNIQEMLYCDINYNEDKFKQIKYLIENFPCD